MNKYIALLRGINVSGQKKIKMTELKDLFDELGFKDTETYIQSGNVVFSESEPEVSKIEKRISAVIKKKFKFDVQVIVVSPEKISNIIKKNPFIKKKIDTDKLYVVFLSEEPLVENIKKLNVMDYSPEEFSINRKIIYLYVPNGYGKAKLNNNFFESKLKVTGSTRNWKTILKLFEMVHQSG